MEKPTPNALAAFAAALPDDPRVVRRKMFGMDAGFVNGAVFLGVFEGGLTLRLGRARVAELAGMAGLGPFAPGGRVWPEYALADADVWVGKPELAAWAREALAFTAALPAKPEAKKKAAKPPKP